jgi:hypothetical protein
MRASRVYNNNIVMRLVGRRAATISFIVLFVLLPSRVYSDLLPSAEIYSMVQTGQNVTLTISSFGSGIESSTSNLSLGLLRHSGEDTEVVLEPTLFTDEQADEIDIVCIPPSSYEDDPEYCVDYPEECSDCDADGILECPGKCYDRYFVSVDDECAPVGWSVYQLIAYSQTNEGFTSELGALPFEVEDSGDSCLDEDENCSVAAIGEPKRHIIIELMLLMIAPFAALSSG